MQLLGGPALERGAQRAPQVTSDEQLALGMLGIVALDDQLAARGRIARRDELDEHAKARAGVQRRRERVRDEPEVQAALIAALVRVLVVLMLLPSRRRIPQLLERRSAVPAGTRLLLLTVVAVAALGVAGTCAALAAFVLVRRRGSAARVAGAGVLVATTIAMAAPWPAGTVWADPWRAVAAVVVSVGTGVVAGSVFAAGLRNGAPSAVRGVRPSDR